MPTIHVDLRELSGLPVDAYVPSASLRVAHLDRVHVEAGGADYVLTENALLVKIIDGVAEFDVPETPAGNILVINEDGFRGARTRYVLVPDVADVNYGDLTEIEPDGPVTPVDATGINALAARNLDMIIVGPVTRDGNGAATGATVAWPDGTLGAYTADTLSILFPGAVDAYHITYGSPVTATYTQPLVTRNSDGAVINLPAIMVS